MLLKRSLIRLSARKEAAHLMSSGDELGCLYAWENNPKQPNPGLRFKGGVKRS
jgi:hypothetical protein